MPQLDGLIDRLGPHDFAQTDRSGFYFTFTDVHRLLIQRDDDIIAGLRLVLLVLSGLRRRLLVLLAGRRPGGGIRRTWSGPISRLSAAASATAGQYRQSRTRQRKRDLFAVQLRPILHMMGLSFWFCVLFFLVILSYPFPGCSFAGTALATVRFPFVLP